MAAEFKPRRARSSSQRVGITSKTERRARLLWWIGASLPPLVSVTMMMLELGHAPDLIDGFDLSEALFRASAGLTVVAGAAMAIAAIRRLGRELRGLSARPASTAREALFAAKEARFRAAWMLLLAACLIALGLVLLMLPERALG